MCRAFSLAGPVRPSGTEYPLAPSNRERRDFYRLRFRSQRQANLPASGQFDIDLGQKFGVKQGAVFRAVAAINAIAGAERIERVFSPGMAHAGHGNRIDHALPAQRGQAAYFQLCIDETEIEAGIVGNEHRFFANEFEEFGRLLVKTGLVGQKCSGNSMNPLCLGGHVTIGIEIAVERYPGGYPIDHFNAANFDQPITVPWVQSGGFGIEYDLAHCLLDICPFAGGYKWDSHLFFSRDRVNQLLHGVSGFGQAHPGIDYMVGQFALLGIRNLKFEDLLELLCGHP